MATGFPLSIDVGDPVARAKSKPPAAPKPRAEQPPVAPQEDLVTRYQTFMEPSQTAFKEAAESEQAFKFATEQDLAARTAEQARARGAALQREKTAIEESGVMQRLADVERETIVPFTPTKDTAMDLAALYGLIGVVGFAIGAGGKGNAIQAMSAMNGMAQGYQQGRMDLYAKEKDIFDTNLKQLKTRADVLEKELARITKMAAYDRQGAEYEAEAVFAEQGASFLKEYVKKYGFPKGLEIAKQNVQNAQKIFELKEKQEATAAEKEAQRQFQRMMQEDRQQAARELRTLAAGLKGDQKTRGGMQQLFMAQRAVNALGGVTSAVESINLLPAGTTAGILPNLTTKDGMFNAVRNFAGRKMSSQEAKAVETLFTGITRNLASIEASGAATGLVGLATQLEKLRPVAGDTTVDVALKMADIRRVAVENIIPLIESGLMPKQQADVADGLVKRMEKAIPYTTSDVINATMRKPEKETISEAGERITGGGTSAYSDPEKERRYQEWKAGQGK